MSAFLLLSVWEAAVGKPGDLARLLRSNLPLSREIRNEIALLVEGKLVPAPQGRGRPPVDELPSITIANWVYSKECQAIANYHKVSNWLRKRGKIYGNADKLASAIARKWGIPDESFLIELKRARKIPALRMPSFDEGAQFKRWYASRSKKNFRI